MRKFLVILAIVHVAGLVSLFTLPFGYDQPRLVYSELFEVDFAIFAVIFALLGTLAAMLLVLPETRFMTGAVCVALVLVSAGAVTLVPAARPLFEAFGADLPAPTLLLFSGYQLWWALPVLAVVAAVFFTRGLPVLVLAANAALFLTLLGLFLPFYKMCGDVELSTGFTRLHAAAALGKVASVRRYLEAGIPVNAETKDGIRPIDVISAGKHPAVESHLVAQGAMRSTPETRRRKVQQAQAASSCGV